MAARADERRTATPPHHAAYQYEKLRGGSLRGVRVSLGKMGRRASVGRSRARAWKEPSTQFSTPSRGPPKNSISRGKRSLSPDSTKAARWPFELPWVSRSILPAYFRWADVSRRAEPLSGTSLPARKLPVFLASGRDSSEYQAAEVCQDLRLMHSAGMSITLRQYPCGHELTPQMLADVDRWIIEQITDSAQAAQPIENEWSFEKE